MNKVFITRVVKDKDHPFFQADKKIFNVVGLSWRAKAILLYLLSKPDDWKLNIDDIIKHSTEGRNAVYSCIDELILFGYLHRVKSKDSKGLFITEYFIYENPLTENPYTVEPIMDSLDLESRNNTNNDSRIDYINTSFTKKDINLNKNKLVSCSSKDIINQQTTDKQNLDLSSFSQDTQIVIKDIISKLNTDELLAKKLDKSFEYIKSQLLKLNDVMIKRTVKKYSEANSAKKIQNHELYFAKCLISAIEEYGFYSIESPIIQKQTNTQSNNRGNFEQRPMESDEYYNSLYANVRRKT